MGIKLVKLEYNSIAKRTSNETAYTVTRERMDVINHSIEQKTKRNAYEIEQSYQAAKEDMKVFKKES